MKNLQQITLQVKDAVDKFQAASGEGGVGEDLQRTLFSANEAMSDLSDSTEALKHNFLFRGFFNRRGFFDLGSLTAGEYKSPAFGKGFKRHRVWLESADLFSKDAKGVETLSAGGKARLDEAMTEILNFPRNGPLMIEGFSGEGTASQQYLVGRRRAVRVQSVSYRPVRPSPYVCGRHFLGCGAGLTRGFLAASKKVWELYRSTNREVASQVLECNCHGEEEEMVTLDLRPAAPDPGGSGHRRPRAFPAD